MLSTLAVLGIDATLTEAVDGKYDTTATNNTQYQTHHSISLSSEETLHSLEHLHSGGNWLCLARGFFKSLYAWISFCFIFSVYPLWLLLSVRALNSSQLQAMGIDMLPGYKDPYSGRVLTRGEIGCFLSHYNIWTQVNIGFTHMQTQSIAYSYITQYPFKLITIKYNCIPHRGVFC